MEVVATLSGKFTKFVLGVSMIFVFVFALEFVPQHHYDLQACLPLFASQQCDHWKSELIDQFLRLQPFCHNITKHVSFSSGDGLSLVLALLPSYPLHRSVWTQTRAQSVLQLYRQVFLSILACSSSHRVLLSGDFESQALNYHPPSKHDHDVINLWTNSTKLRLRNYFLSFAVGARPKNFWKDKAKWVFPKILKKK